MFDRKSDINPLEYRMGTTVEAEQDQKRTNARRSAQHRATIRNFPVDAENYWTLNCIEPAADGVRKYPALRYSNDGKSQKSRPPGFPNRNSLFALAIGKPGWRLDSNAQRY